MTLKVVPECKGKSNEAVAESPKKRARYSLGCGLQAPW